MSSSRNSAVHISAFIFFAIIAIALSASAQWSTDPAVNTPVCTAADYQTSVRSAPDDSNGVIIVWDDSRYPDYGIYAQRLDENGVALWTLNGVSVSINDGVGGNLVLVSDGGGGAIFAWPRSGDIIVQRVNGQGVPMWGPNGVPICADPGTQGSPLGIASDGANGAIVTWNDFRAPAAVYARRVNGAGVAQWGGSVHLGLGRTYWNDGTISDEAGGIIAMAYPPAGAGVGVQRVSGSGARLWGASGVLLTPVTASGLGSNSADGSMGICLVPDGFSGAIFTWQSGYPNSDIFAQRLDQNGTRMWTPAGGVPICTDGSAQTNPNLCASDSADAIIAWTDYRTPALAPDIYAQRISRIGAVQWTVNGVPVSTQRRASEVRQIVSDGENGAIISWTEYDDFTFADVWSQRVNASGQSLWTANGEAISIASSNQVYPQMVGQVRAGAVVVWEDNRNEWYSSDIYAQQIGCNGVLASICPFEELWFVRIQGSVKDVSGQNCGLCPEQTATKYDSSGFKGQDLPKKLAATIDMNDPQINFKDLLQQDCPNRHRDKWCEDQTWLYAEMLLGKNALKMRKVELTAHSYPYVSHGNGRITTTAAGVATVVWPGHSDGTEVPQGKLNATFLAKGYLQTRGIGGGWASMSVHVVFNPRHPENGGPPPVAPIDTTWIANFPASVEDGPFRVSRTMPAGLRVGHKYEYSIEIEHFATVWSTNPGATEAQAIAKFNGDMVWPGAVSSADSLVIFYGESSETPPVSFDFGVPDTTFPAEEGGGSGKGEWKRPREETVLAEENADLPLAPALHGSIPNPFNPSTIIPYDVPLPGGEVSLAIYDVSDRLVRKLIQEVEEPGKKRVAWDGRNDDGEQASSGVYFCRMNYGSFSQTRKVVLLR